MLLKIYELKEKNRGKRYYTRPRKGIAKKLYVEPEVVDLEIYMIRNNPYAQMVGRKKMNDTMKGKEVVGNMAGKNITLPQTMKRLNAKQKHFIYLMYSDYYDKEFGCYTRDNPLNAWLVVYATPKMLEKMGYFDFDENGKKYKFNFHNQGTYMWAYRLAYKLMRTPTIKEAMNDLIAELFGDKEEIRSQLTNKLLSIIEKPDEKGSTKVNAIKELAKIIGIADEKKVVEHRVIDASEQRKIVGQLSGKDNPFAHVGTKEYSTKELLTDEKPEGNIQ